MITAAHHLSMALRGAAIPVTGAVNDYDSLFDRIGEARFVLLGGASPGTHEFCRERAMVTRRLIREKGFRAVVVDAGWTDAYRVNRFVRGAAEDRDAVEALAGFLRFPAWVWRNTDMVDFIDWLRNYNDSLPAGGEKAGFYGLDLYNLYSSMSDVVAWLGRVDREAAERARQRYAHFELFHCGDSGLAAGFGLAPSLEKDLANRLAESLKHQWDSQSGRWLPEDDIFIKELHARTAGDAAQYYRLMFGSRTDSWNHRARHLAETLDSLVEHLGRDRGPAKIVVWGHNSHLGDARATDLGPLGEINLGQLVRQRHQGDNLLVGFSTYAGTVAAASAWEERVERMVLQKALRESYEAVLHEAGLPQCLLLLGLGDEAAEALSEPRLERAVGIVYRPWPERASDYFTAMLPRQFDAIIHLDETRAVEPLEHFVPLSTVTRR